MNKATPMPKQEFVEVFDYLRDNVESFEKGTDEDIERRQQNRLKAHYRALKVYSRDVYERGVNWYLDHTESRNFPLPADIRQAIHESYKPPDDDQSDPDAPIPADVDLEWEKTAFEQIMSDDAPGGLTITNSESSDESAESEQSDEDA